MMIEYIEVQSANEKSRICNDILRALPSWFGIESSIVDYVDAVRGMPFIAAVSDGRDVGFVALKVHNRYTAEVHIMGILSDYHRQGIGTQLIKQCESYCTAQNMRFLTVKTLDESRESDSYAKTRKFYLSMGFAPLEVFPLLWDEDNPCLFMAKSI